MSNKLSLIVSFIAADKMSNALRGIVGLGNRGSTSIRALNTEARRLQREIAAAGRAISSSSGNVTDLVNRERDLNRTLIEVNRQLDRRKQLLSIDADNRAMHNRARDLRNSGQGNVMGGVALATPIIAAVAAAGEFSSGMVDIQQKGELTNRQTEMLAANILVASRNARQLPESMRSGFDALLARGMRVDEALDVIRPAGRLATAFKVEIPDAAAAAHASISNLRVPASETARIFDTMAMAGNRGSFEVSDMARHFPSLTAQMQALGDRGVGAVADLSAALEVAMHTAGNSDEAANNIQNLMSKINAPATINAFRKNFGVDLPASMRRLREQGYGALEAIAIITERATKGDMGKLNFAFEDQQARFGIMALMQNMEEYREIRRAALQSGGTVDQAFNQRVAQDATVQWRAFLGTAQRLAITLGTTLLPAIKNVMGNVDRAVTAFSNWAQANPRAASALMHTAAALVMARIGLGALQIALGTILGPFATVLTVFRKTSTILRFAGVFGRVGTAIARVGPMAVRMFGFMRTAALFMGQGFLRAGLMMLANPIVLAITAVVAAIGIAAYLIYANWDKIKAAFDRGVAWIHNAFDALPRWLTGIGSAMMAGLIGALNPGVFAQHLLRIARNGIDAFKNFFGIKSPSRLMMAMGGHMTSGLAQGIDRGARDPTRSVSRMASGITAAGEMHLTPMRGAHGSGARSRAATGNTYNVHVYGAAGQDAQALARAVMREIDRVTMTRARGAYRDA